MTIAELGAIGEFIGSIAVLMTLVYLTVQVRMSRRESRAALLQHRSDAARSLWITEATNPALTNAILKGNRDLGFERPMLQALAKKVSLDEAELASVTAFASAHFLHRQTMFLSELNPSERIALDNQIVTIFGTGLNRAWFDYLGERVENMGYDALFVEHVKDLFVERGT